MRAIPTGAQIDANDAALVLKRLEPFGVLQMEAAQQREVTFMLAPVGSPHSDVATTARGWQFVAPDRTCVFTLFPNVGSVQILAGYDRWSTSLRPHLTALLEIMRDMDNSPLVQRVGLRYLNRLGPAPDGHDWLKVVDGSIAGVLTHPVLGGSVRSAHQQFELVLESAVGALFVMAHWRQPMQRGATSST